MLNMHTSYVFNRNRNLSLHSVSHIVRKINEQNLLFCRFDDSYFVNKDPSMINKSILTRFILFSL